MYSGLIHSQSILSARLVTCARSWRAWVDMMMAMMLASPGLQHCPGNYGSECIMDSSKKPQKLKGQRLMRRSRHASRSVESRSILPLSASTSSRRVTASMASGMRPRAGSLNASRLPHEVDRRIEAQCERGACDESPACSCAA